MRKATAIVCLLLASVSFVLAQQRIVFYNVENLFDTRHDSLYQDSEYTPEGNKHWNYQKYQTKLDHIAQVIANIGGWQTPMAVGLCEVENEQCLNDLTRYGGLKNYGYHYLHHDGPDVRGIDCALLYDPQQFRLLQHQFISVALPDRPTREFVYAQGETQLQRHKKDTLHIYVCHMPSRLGGEQATALRRTTARQTLQAHIDSVLHMQPMARIILMGDFNQEPQDDIPPLHNLMIPLYQAGEGTYKYNGIWNCLDQFYCTPNLLPLAKAYIFNATWLQQEDRQHLGTRPWRTYHGMRYTGGYSDHLPVYMDIHPTNN